MPYYAETKGSIYQTAELGTLVFPNTAINSFAGRKCLLALHGRGGVGAQIINNSDWHQHIRGLAEAGYIVYGIDAGAQSTGAGTTDANRYKVTWGNDDAMTAITAAKTYLLSTRGANGSTKVGFLDYSLGGGQGFNWLYRNSTLCAGVISYAPAADYDWFYSNLLTANSGGSAELELSYATNFTTTTGGGTLNQVGSNVTVTSGTGHAASGQFVLYQITTQGTYTNPIKVSYTGGGGTTTFTGCTIATGSQTWGTSSTTGFTGVATWGGYATNKATRSPLLIASAAAFDQVPVHCYLAADDSSVGVATTPAQYPSMVGNWADAVGPNAAFHTVRGGQYSTTNTTCAESKILSSSSTTLNITSGASFPSGAGNAVIETGEREPRVIAFTSRTTNTLNGVTALTGSFSVTSGMVIYNSSLSGHTSLFGQIPATDIVAIVNKFAW